MKEYKVKVYKDKTEWYNFNNQLHRLEGPAVEYFDGEKYWYINGEKLTKNEFYKRINSSYSGKIVEIDDKKYKLTEI